MFDLLKEKHQVLSRVGSFWYKTLEDEASQVPNRLTHIPYLCKVMHKFGNIIRLVLGKDKITVKYVVIRFKDSDINGNTLLVDKNLLITSLFQDDSILTKDVSFNSGYGFIEFNKDPRALFPKMRFSVRSGLRRVPNIWCYQLGLQDTYGDVSQVVEYYRNNQSVVQFYRASAQAAGMQVIKQDDIIDRVIDLQENLTVYLTKKGDRYDVYYTHQKLQPGDTVAKGQVIGAENFRLYTDKDDVSDITYVRTGYSCPVPQLIIPNKDDVTLYKDGYFKPDYEGPNVHLYWEYLNLIGAAEQPVTQSATGNPLHHLRTTIAPGRTLLIYIDDALGIDMKNRLIRFIDTNAPIGSIILWAYKD